MKYQFIPAANYTPVDKRLIIIHWIVGEALACARWMQNKHVDRSYHYTVSKEGEVYQLVEEQDIAWHAGVSSLPGYPTTWMGVEWNSLNPCSIGISLEGPPSYVHGMNEWPEKQLIAVADLCKDIATRHKGIKITDHMAVSPGSKIDVRGGSGIDVFPWEKFVAMTGLQEA